MEKQKQKSTRYLASTSFNDSHKQQWPFLNKSDKAPHFVFCTICRSNIIVARGVAEIKKHVQTSKHEENSKDSATASTPSIKSLFHKASDTMNESDCVHTWIILLCVLRMIQPFSKLVI